jgi:SAM-dependent methyltransferase
MIELNCLKCRRRLEEEKEKYVCSCGQSYPIMDGIPVFAKNTNYYGEIPRERKMQLLGDMDKGAYWRDLVWEYFGMSSPFLHHIIVDETRNDFRFILPLDRESRVLDLGAGWGTMSCHFARDCKEVIALDGILDRCQFIAKRCIQDRVPNVIPICANILDNPFSNRSFDVIIMNGVLEWVGASRNGRSPQERQLEALKIVRKMLKEDGVLYIGIENSHGFKYILGEMDDHTGRHHISYLTRDKANEKALEELKRPYDTYTYDKLGYTELLRSAGFDRTRFYYPIPDYKSVQILLPLENPHLLLYYHRALNSNAHSNSLTERVRSLECRAARLGHVSHYVASYGIVAGNSSRSSQHKYINQYLFDNWQKFLEAKPATLETIQISSTPGKYFHKGRIKQLIFVNNQQEPSLVATYCRSKNYETSLYKEHDLFVKLRNLEISEFKTPERPHIGKINGYSILFREAWKGATLSSHLAQCRYSQNFSQGKLEEIVRQHFQIALKCLKALHHATQERSNHALPYIFEVSRKLECMYGESILRKWQSIADDVHQLHKQGSDCVIHGDFTPWNIMLLEVFDSSPHIGIIDWELSQSNPFTILDYGRFVYYYLTELENLGIVGESREEAINAIFVRRKHWLSEVIEEFLKVGLARYSDRSFEINRLMQFVVFHDAVLQNEYSTKPSGPLRESYLRILHAFE